MRFAQADEIVNFLSIIKVAPKSNMTALIIIDCISYNVWPGVCIVFNLFIEK
jgi:hypothetical protein